MFIEYKAPFQIGVLSIREGCASFCYNGFRIIVNPDIRIDSEQREKLTNIAIVIANQKLEKFLCSFKRNYFPVTTFELSDETVSPSLSDCRLGSIKTVIHSVY